MTIAAKPKPDESALEMTRLFDAPRALVWKAWTDPALAVNWWGPRDFPVKKLKMDVRPGGTWRNCLISPDTGEELWQGGVFREVAAPERLVFTFAWEEAGERGLETLVTITLTDEGDKTRMRFRQEPFQSIAERDGHEGGWSSSFERLVEELVEQFKAFKQYG